MVRKNLILQDQFECLEQGQNWTCIKTNLNPLIKKMILRLNHYYYYYYYFENFRKLGTSYKHQNIFRKTISTLISIFLSQRTLVGFYLEKLNVCWTSPRSKLMSMNLIHASRSSIIVMKLLRTKSYFIIWSHGFYSCEKN